MKKREKLIELLSDLDDHALVNIHNNFCEKQKYFDDIIYQVAEFEFIIDMASYSAKDFIQRFGDIDFNDKYFIDGIYGATSFNYYEDSPVYMLDDICNYILTNDDDLDNIDIKEILETEDEE